MLFASALDFGYICALHGIRKCSILFDMKLKALILLFCTIFIFHSCSVAMLNKYEEPLSLTTEKFEKTVVGVWKCVCSGTNYS